MNVVDIIFIFKYVLVYMYKYVCVDIYMYILYVYIL